MEESPRRHRRPDVDRTAEVDVRVEADQPFESVRINSHTINLG